MILGISDMFKMSTIIKYNPEIVKKYRLDKFKAVDRGSFGIVFTSGLFSKFRYKITPTFPSYVERIKKLQHKFVVKYFEFIPLKYPRTFSKYDVYDLYDHPKNENPLLYLIKMERLHYKYPDNVDYIWDIDYIQKACDSLSQKGYKIDDCHEYNVMYSKQEKCYKIIDMI